MHQIRFIHPPQDNPVLRRRAIIASIVCHGLMMTALLLLTLYYASLPPPPNGSAAGSTTMTLEPMVVAATPSEPPPPSPTPPLPTPPLPAVTVPTPVTPMTVPEIGLPVLPPAPVKTTLAKNEEPHHAAKSHSTSENSAKAAATAVASSYSPGASYFKHPPYPEEARSLGESGTVVVLVEFNSQGGVSRAEIAATSGVPLLDSTTRAFIRENWHSSEYAGQSINVPVEYQLESR